MSGARELREVQLENVHPLRLRLLLEIERTGSISAAAETCSIGQPSASVHLRTLEAAIGQSLVVRSGRGSNLTAAGRVVASHAARLLATLDSMRRDVDGLDPRHGGELVLAASFTPSVALIPGILRRFSDRYPGVSVTLRTVPSETVVRKVGRAEADIGIAEDVPTAEPVVRTEMLVDELIGIAPPGLLTLDGGWVSLRQLAGYSLLSGPDGSSTKIASERYLSCAEYRPAGVWVLDSYEAIKRAVAAGVGVSFSSRLLVREEIQRGELIPFRISGIDPVTWPIQVVRSSFRELTQEGAAFMTLLADAAWTATKGATTGPLLARRVAS